MTRVVACFHHRGRRVGFPLFVRLRTEVASRAGQQPLCGLPLGVCSFRGTEWHLLGDVNHISSSCPVILLTSSRHAESIHSSLRFVLYHSHSVMCFAVRRGARRARHRRTKLTRHAQSCSGQTQGWCTRAMCDGNAPRGNLVVVQ